MKWILEESYADSARIKDALQVRLKAGDELVIGHDDGFLGQGEMSPYRYFVSRQNRHQEENTLFYIFLPVPKYWEIRAYYQYGLVVDHQVVKAKIYFTEPIEKRNVKEVHWMMEDGWVYRKDYYDKYAFRYISEFLGRDGRVESRCYYSDWNQETVVEQPLSEVITLLDGGQVVGEFYSYREWIEYWLGAMGEKVSADTEE